MSKKSINVPNLRFPGFEGEWERQKLGEIAEFSKGKGISKSDVDENGETECIRYGELYTHYGEVIAEIKSRTNINRENLVFSEANDVIIPSSGETQIDIATASCVLKSGVALGGDLNIIKTPNNGVFLSYYLNSRKKLEIANLAQGISVVHLYASQLALLEVAIPDVKEQNRIANFLALLNKRINTQNKIIEELKLLKSYLNRKIFTRQLRISQLKEKWRKIRLGEISTRISTKNKELNQNVLTISAQFGLISQLDFFNKSIASKDISGYYLLQKGDFAYNKSYSSGYPMGAIKKLNYYDKGVVSTLYICFRFSNDINSKFMEQYFESGIHNVEIEKIAQEGGRNHGLLNIGISDFFDIQVYLPGIEEQNRIANFLSSVGEKIETEKKILQQYESQKKHLLQNMFM